YRNFAIAPELPVGRSAWLTEGHPHGIVEIAASVWSSMLTLTDPAGQQRAYRLLMYREMPGGENGYRFKVYIRNDMLPYYNDVRYGQ
ncbi:MAG: flippase activity-associated protein Agl23, partial [Thermomicrobiales bacterium]